MFKYFPYITILLLLISTVSCKNKSEQIPINNIWEHIKYQNKVGVNEVEKEYKILFDKNKKSPELYFLYSRSIKDYTYKKYNSGDFLFLSNRKSPELYFLYV